MAISTINTFLLNGGAASGAASYGAALIDINDMPDLEGENEEIDVTTLSDDARKFVEGLKNNASWVFTCNYTKADYEALAALAGTENWYAVYLGGTAATPTGADGIFEASGYLSVKKTAAAKGEAHEMSVKIVLTSAVSET
jgi:hypothetical protein